MKKTCLLGLSILLTVSAIVGCAAPASAPEQPDEEAPAVIEETTVEEPAQKEFKDLVIGYSQMENNMPWRVAETNNMKTEAEKRGINLIYADAQSDTAKQISDVESLIAQGIDYLLISPREYDGLEGVLEDANEAGVPVIMVDRDASGEKVTYIHPDNVLEGAIAARMLAKALDGKGNVVELTGTEGSSGARDRQKGFTDTIASEFPDIKIIVSQTGDFSRIKGKDTMANILQSKGDEINAVYAHNDEMGLGAIEAIEADGRFVVGEDILIASIDGQNSGVQAVADGKFLFTIECTPFYGPFSFDAVESHFKGEDVPKDIFTIGNIFTIDGEGGTVDGYTIVKAADYIGKQF